MDPLQATFKVAAVSGIFFIWVKYTKEAFKFAWHIISTSPFKTVSENSPEKYKASFKAVCGYCQELYDDEYHLIHGTHLCEACR